MHPSLRRLVRLGLPAVVVLAAGLAGCGEPTPAPSAPSASSSPTTAPAGVPAVAGSTGSDGLTVRYLGDDGSVKTVRVEDFPAER